MGKPNPYNKNKACFEKEGVFGDKISKLIVDGQMNKKISVLIGLMAFGFLTLGVGKVWGEMTVATIDHRVTTACEYPNGDLSAVNDDIARKDYCRANGKLVYLGEVSTNGEVATGNVLFTDGTILMKDGTAWEYGVEWYPVVSKNLPPEVKTTDIVQWSNGSYFLTKNGDVYQYDQGDGSGGAYQGWKNRGSPGNPVL